jgi:dimeric dUTPase (all-alpha-NTP-PPase superfamily)
MNLKEFLHEQKVLDDMIISTKNLQSLDPNVRLTNTLLALSVEVSELANEMRTFKHWSNRPMSSKEKLLDEYADVMHFMFSLANQLGFTAEDLEGAYKGKHEVNQHRQNVGY